MFVEQLYTNCLAEAAYYVESNGEAAIIDPLRETEPYLNKLEARGVNLKYVLETHFHADFVSGHIDLAKKTGAKIIFGPNADTNYETYNAKDGELIELGKIKIKVLHTPGHTPESTCYLLLDEEGKEHCIFTGDTLFVGDVGRPDLLDGKMTKEELAGMMYDSLNTKIKLLPNDVIVYPAHGPGSACGKNIGKETWSTIGQQKESNYALQEMPKEKFIEILTEGLSAPPAYFFKDASINKEGYSSIDEVLKKNVKPLTVSEVKDLMKSDLIILDTRTPDDFEKGFIPGSVNIGLNGTYAVWVGTLLSIDTPMVVVCDEGKEQESILRLARVGFENVMGFLKGGVMQWINEGGKVSVMKSITPEEFALQREDKTNTVLDVRKEGEFELGHVEGAQHICLSKLLDSFSELPKEKNYLVHCAGGYRSMIAVSLLKKAGYENIVNVYGGFAKIKSQENVPIKSLQGA